MLQAHSPETVRFQTFVKQNQGHSRLMLFRSLFTTDPKSARYQVDILPEKNIPF